MLRDFVYAARNLRSSPAFALTSVLTLALGAGAITGIFSVAEAVILRPLPYKDPGRLVYACNDFLIRHVPDHLWSGPNYLDLRDHASATLEDVAAVSTARGNFPRDDGTPEEVVSAEVTPNLFRAIGARVVLGRDFLPSDGQPDPVTADGAPPPPDQRLPIYAIASQEYFQRRFGGNPAALGKPLMKNGPILVGVLERGVELLFRPDKNIERHPDVWMALRIEIRRALRNGTERSGNRGRTGCRADADAGDEQHAGGRAADRSADLRRRGGFVPGHHRRGDVDAGASRGGARSLGGVAAGIAERKARRCWRGSREGRSGYHFATSGSN